MKPLPYPDGDRLVQVWNTYDTWRGHEVLDALWDRIGLSYPEYQRWRTTQRSFDATAVLGTAFLPITWRGDPDEAPIGVASASLFGMLGAEPVRGRGFTEQEQGAGAPQVTVISHEAWRDRYGSDPDILGQVAQIADVPFEIIGVLPPRFVLQPAGQPGLERHAMWVPLGGLGEDLNEGDHSYQGLGILSAGTTLEQAHAETARILRGDATPEQRGARLAYRKTEETGSARAPLLMLAGAVALLLLISCGNFATADPGSVALPRREAALQGGHMPD